MIPILPSTAWREFRGEVSKKGLNQTTHQAMIEDATGKWHRCYVKGCPDGWLSPLTEAIGWLIAEALDLPRPEFAALVMVPLDKLRQHMPMDQHWLNRPEMLAFCASAVEGKSPSHPWQWMAKLRTKQIYKHAEVARIAAFDYWVDNQDRNTGNLLVKSDGVCVPIDNEFILYSLLWQPYNPFSIGKKSLLAESALLLTETNQRTFKVEMANQSRRHESAMNMVSPRLKDAISALIPDKTVAHQMWNDVQKYLFDRAHPDWLSTELGVIT